jgi:hypothetical protein
MVTVTLVNADSDGSDTDGPSLAGALQLIASAVPAPPNPYDSDATSPVTGAVYFTPPFESYVDVEGCDFYYGANGLLEEGLITSIDIQVYGPPDDTMQGYAETSYTGLSLPVDQAYELAASDNPAAVLLARGALYEVNSPVVHGDTGNDTFVVNGAGQPDPGLPPPVAPTTTIYGAGGVNAADFPNTFRTDATIIGGGDDETVGQSGITADLVGVQTLHFIDGSMYEDNASVGAQAALMFEGILGRLPDPTNAGGFALLAQQIGLPAAGDAMLATAEGQADTSSLTNAQYVTRLYQNMLQTTPDATSANFWESELASGQVTRGGVAAVLAGSSTAQIVNATAFASNSVFAADPGAVDVLRAYEVLLGRLPEETSLAPNAAALDSGALSLPQLYAEMQASPEFASKEASNPYGLTASSSYATVYGVTHSNAVTAMIAPFITIDGGVAHLSG